MLFKCKQSGCIYEFKEEHDIIEMLKHPQYEEVSSEEIKEKPKAKKD